MGVQGVLLISNTLAFLEWQAYLIHVNGLADSQPREGLNAPKKCEGRNFFRLDTYFC
jgi:hypothetical protein